MSRIQLLIVTGLLVSISLAGCDTPKNVKGDVIGKTTTEIGEFDPEQGAKVSDGKMESTNPLNPLAPMKAYKPAVEKIMKLQVQQALNLYNATEGNYPKTHEEFMEKVVKPYGVKLAKLPGDWVYQYDVANHELVVVEQKKESDEEK